MTIRRSIRERKPDAVLSSVDATATPQRHGAITRTLPSYATYKRWADQMKTGWKGLEDPNR